MAMKHDFHYDEKTEIMEAMNSWVKSMISYCDPIADDPYLNILT